MQSIISILILLFYPSNFFWTLHLLQETAKKSGFSQPHYLQGTRGRREIHARSTQASNVKEESNPTSSLTLAPDLLFDECMFVFLTGANMQPSLCFPKLGKNATVICLDRLTKRIFHVVDVIWPQLPKHFSFLFKSNRISKIRWTCAVKILRRSHKKQ